MGTSRVVDPENVILDPSQPISLLRFGIDNTRIESYLLESLLAVARHFRCDGQTPFENLPERARDRITSYNVCYTKLLR